MFGECEFMILVGQKKVKKKKTDVNVPIFDFRNK